MNFYIETYGCQMNVADSEIVASILKEHGHSMSNDINATDIILINTCSVRENAEIRVRGRLDLIKQLKKKNKDLIVGVIGCMAQRLKEELQNEIKIVDVVAGPDAYRALPLLIEQAGEGNKALNVDLSEYETYDGILPFRYKTNNISAFIPIMRGCDNKCAYCVVPGTRGTERSSSPDEIIEQISGLRDKNYREVTLIGQNVNSYHWEYPDGKLLDFAGLLERVAVSFPSLWFRFSTSHPKDMSDEVLYTMARHENLCKCIHLPVQSGSTRMLGMMNRRYTRVWYLGRIDAIRRILPDCAVTTDIIAGFCSETEEDHTDTISLMEYCRFDFAFMFKYNERPGTFAMENYPDDVPAKVKTRRLTEIIELQNRLSEYTKNSDLGKVVDVLVEGYSKKSKEFLSGRNSQNKVVVFPAGNFKKGDFVKVKITSCTSATLIGEVS